MTPTLLVLVLLEPPGGTGPAPLAIPDTVQVPEDPHKQLLELFAEAEKRYLERDYTGALAVFARAYEQSQDPTCLANMGRIHEDLRQYTQAAGFYRRFLRHPLSSPSDRDTIAQRLDRLPGIEPVRPVPAPVVAAPRPAPAPLPVPVVSAVDPRPRRQAIAGSVLVGLSAPPLVVAALYFQRVREIQSNLATAAYPSHDERLAAIDRGQTAQWIAVATVSTGSALFVAGVALATVGTTRGRAAARALQRAGRGLRFEF